MSRPARRRTAEADAEGEWAPSDWEWNPSAMSAQRSKPRAKLAAAPLSQEGTADTFRDSQTDIAPTEVANPKFGSLPVYNSIKKLDDKGPITCVVEGCEVSLAGLKRYFTRLRICEAHLASLAIVVDGVISRFCQQCGRFQPLGDFAGKRKSCAARLEVVNARYRGRAAQKGQAQAESPAIKAEPVDVAKTLLMTAPLAATRPPAASASAAAVAAASESGGAGMDRCASLVSASSAAATPLTLVAAPSAEVAPPASSPEPSGATDSGRASGPARMDSASSVPQAPAAAVAFPAVAVAANEPRQRVLTTSGPGLVWYSTRRWTPAPPPGSSEAFGSRLSSSSGAPASPPPAPELHRPQPLPQPVYWNQVTTAIQIHTAKDGSAVAAVAPPPPEEVRKALLAAEGQLYQPVPARRVASGTASRDVAPRRPLLAAGSGASFTRTSVAAEVAEGRSGGSPEHEPSPPAERRHSGSVRGARGGSSSTVSVAGASGLATGAGAADPYEGSVHGDSAYSAGSPAVPASGGGNGSSGMRAGSVAPEPPVASSRTPAVAVTQVAQRISTIVQELAPLIQQAEDIAGTPDAAARGPSPCPAPESVFAPAREVLARATRLASVLEQCAQPPVLQTSAPQPLRAAAAPRQVHVARAQELQPGPGYPPQPPASQRESSSTLLPQHIGVQAAPGQESECYMRAASASSVYIRQPLLPAQSRRAALHEPPLMQRHGAYASYGSLRGAPPPPSMNGYGPPQFAPQPYGRAHPHAYGHYTPYSQAPYGRPRPQAHGPPSSAPYSQAPGGQHPPPPQPYADNPYGGYPHGPAYGPPPPQPGGWPPQAPPAQGHLYSSSSAVAQPATGAVVQPPDMFDMLDDDAEAGVLFRLLEEFHGKDEPGTDPGSPSNPTSPSAYQQLCAQQSAVEACQERSRTVAHAVQQGVAVHRRGLAQMPYAAAASGAAAWPSMGPGPSSGSSSGSGAAVPMDLDRVSIKAMNMQPQELPHNLRSGMGRWLQGAGAEAVQATLRQGCLQLVVDVRRPAAAAAAAPLAGLLIPRHDADHAATHVFRFMGQRLRDTFVQVGDQVLQIRVGEDPVVLGWGQAAEEGGLAGAKMPRIAACSAAAVCAGGEARLQLSGSHLAQPGLKVFARLRGCDVPACLLPAPSCASAPASSASASAPCGEAEVCVEVPAGCPGLMVVEVGLGHLLGGWWPVLVLPRGGGAAAEELAGAMEPSDPAQPDGPKALDRRLVTDLGHVLDTLAAIESAAAAAAIEAAVAAAEAAEAAAAEAAAATSTNSPNASPNAGASSVAALPAAAASNGGSASPGSPGSQGGAGAGSTTTTSAAGWSYTDGTDTLASSGVDSTRLTSRMSVAHSAQGAVDMSARPNAAREPGIGSAPADAARPSDAHGAAPASGRPALAQRAPRPVASAVAPPASTVRQALARAARLLLFTVARGLPHLTELLLDAAARLAAALPPPEPAPEPQPEASPAASGPLAAAGLLPQALLPLAVLSGCGRVVDALAAFAEGVLGEPLRLDLPQGPAGMTLLHLAAVMDDGGAMASHLVASQPWAAWSWLCLRWAPPMLEPPPRAAPTPSANEVQSDGHPAAHGAVAEELDGVDEAEADAVRLTPGALSLLLGQTAPQRTALGMLVLDPAAPVVVGERGEAEEHAAREAARAGQVAEAAEGVVEAWGCLSASLLEALCGQLAGQQL